MVKVVLDEILGFHQISIATTRIKVQNINEKIIQFIGDKWGIKEYP